MRKHLLKQTKVETLAHIKCTKPLHSLWNWEQNTVFENRAFIQATSSFGVERKKYNSHTCFATSQMGMCNRCFPSAHWYVSNCAKKKASMPRNNKLACGVRKKKIKNVRLFTSLSTGWEIMMISPPIWLISVRLPCSWMWAQPSCAM